MTPVTQLFLTGANPPLLSPQPTPKPAAGSLRVLPAAAMRLPKTKPIVVLVCSLVTHIVTPVGSVFLGITATVYIRRFPFSLSCPQRTLGGADGPGSALGYSLYFPRQHFESILYGRSPSPAASEASKQPSLYQLETQVQLPVHCCNMRLNLRFFQSFNIKLIPNVVCKCKVSLQIPLCEQTASALQLSNLRCIVV